LTTSILSATENYFRQLVVTNTCKVAVKRRIESVRCLRGSVAEKVERSPPMKQDLSRVGRPKPLRRTAARSFSLATKQQRFQEVEGRCEACGELIGDGTDWRRAIYHHRRLASDPNVTDKEARAAANCMCCIRRATTTRSNFITCTDFGRTLATYKGRRLPSRRGSAADVHHAGGHRPRLRRAGRLFIRVESRFLNRRSFDTRARHGNESIELRCEFHRTRLLTMRP
jgi:hypothetical protein